MMHKILFIVALILILPSAIQSQIVKDSLAGEDFSERFYQREDIWNFKDTFYREDTSINYFTSPYRKEELNLFEENLGIDATPQFIPLRNQFENQLDLGLDHLQSLYLKPLSYSPICPSPLSELRYIQGYRNALHMEARHYRNILPNWNVGLRYRRVKNHNIYYDYSNSAAVNQEVRIGNITGTVFSSHYFSHKRNFEQWVDVALNRNENQESGGAKNPSDYDTLEGRARLNVNEPKHLNAFNNNNQVLAQVHSIYRFARTSQDTIFKRKDYKMGVYHQLKYNSEKYRFYDNAVDSVNYTNINPHPIEIFDSLYSSSFYNSIGLLIRTNFFRFDGGIRHSYDKVVQNRSNLAYNHISLSAKGSLFLQNWSLEGAFDYFISGYRNQDNILKINLINQHPLHQLNIGLESQFKEATFVENNFSSTAFVWQNNFQKQNIQTLSANYLEKLWVKNLQLSFSLQNLGNFIYFNQSYQPIQSSKAQQIIQLDASKLFKINNTYLDLNVRYYRGSEFYPLPSFVTYSKLYQHLLLFKKALELNAGIDFYYYSAYEARYYHPTLRQFTLQDQAVGNYPYLGVFINGKIKAFHFFLRYNHLNEGFSGGNYFSSYAYSTYRGHIQLGVNWRLYN